jgi:hypothetical protein
MDHEAFRDKYMQSGEFARFVDEDVRYFAQECVQRAIEAMEHGVPEGKKAKMVKKSQLHSIPAVVQIGGSYKLAELAQRQSDKHSKLENKAFWGWLKQIIAPQGEELQGTLPGLIMGHMQNLGFDLPDPKEFKEKSKRKARRKENEALVSPVQEQVLAVFCEHFICHYTYTVTEE